MVLGGMMVGKTDIPSLLHPFRSWRILPMRRACWRGRRWIGSTITRGTRLIMGNALVARLLDSLKQNAVEIRYQTQLSELIEDGGKIAGAVFTTNDGDIAIRARKGVVLATGGIGWSSELRDRLFPEGTQRYSMAPDSNTGDGILAGERAHGEIAQDVEEPGAVDAEFGDAAAGRPPLGLPAHHARSRQTRPDCRQQRGRPLRQRSQFVS